MSEALFLFTLLFRFRRNTDPTLAGMPTDIQVMVKKKLEATCEKYKNKEAAQVLWVSLKKSRECMAPVRLYETTSNDYQKRSLDCTSDAREALRDCLPEEQKYFPDFMLERHQAFYRFIYRFFLTKFFATGYLNEVWARCIKAIHEPTALISCMAIPAVNTYEPLFEVPPKKEMCRITEEGDRCIAGYIKATCEKDITITKVVNRLFLAMQVPCRKEINQETSK